MATQHIHNVSIKGIAAAVPQPIKKTTDATCWADAEEAARYIENVGVAEVRRHHGDITCSDLCVAALEQLLADASWDKQDIDLLVYVSQSQDYILPATACVIHGRLGLPQTCHCFDISLGCSGWTYGISVVGAMMQSGGFRKAVLLAGDAGSNFQNAGVTVNETLQKNTKPLFGDAGTATLLEYDETAPAITSIAYTDGTGYEAIIKREGCSRIPFNANTLNFREDKHGNLHRGHDTEMDGGAVFVFGITKIPRAVKEMLKYTEQTVEDVDYFVFHQANLMMNEQIRKKCKIPAEKCPYSLARFGNNSSASIPLTIVTEIREQLTGTSSKLITCGFGVGLSWSTLNLSLQNPIISALVEVPSFPKQ